MKHFKLKFSRFDGDTVVVGEAVARIGIDDTGMSATANRVVATFDLVGKSAEKNAVANEQFAKSVSSVKTSLKTVKADAVRSFNTSLGGLREQLGSKQVSPKTKAKISGFLGKTRTSGYDNLKISQSNFLSKQDTNKVMTMNTQAQGLLSTAQADQAKYYNSIQKEGLKILEERAKLELQLSKSQSSNAFVDTGSVEKQSSALDKLRNSLTSVNTASEGAKNKFKGFINELKSVAVTWRILSGFFRGIINTFANLYDSAASYEEALNLYRTSFGEYAEAADKWAERISSALYLDPKDVMQYAGAFYNLTSGLGVSSKAAYLMSTNLTQLSYDMSSFLNIDVESAQAKIQSAMTGQSRAVASAGVAMQQATLQELAYSLGIQKNVADMTQAEKTYLRYIQLMRSTANMQMDLGKTIISPENALRVVKAQFVQLSRAIGQVFIPIVMAAIPYIMLLTQALQRLATWLGKKLGYEIAPIDYSNFKTASTYMDGLGDAADTTAGKVGKVGKAVDNISRSLASFDELNVVESESSSASPGSAGGVGGGGIGGGGISDLEPFLEGYDMLGKLTADFDKQLDTARENIKKILPIVEAIGGALLAWKISKKFIEDYLKVKDFMDNSKPLFEVISSPAAQTVGIVAGLIANVVANFKSVNDETDRFKEAWENNDLAEYFKIDSLDELIDKVRTFTFILQGGLPAALAIAGAKMGWFEGLIKKVKEGFGTAKEFIIKQLNNIKDKLVEIYEKNVAPIVEDIKKLWDEKLKPVFDKLKGAFDMTMDLIDKVVIKSGLLSSSFEIAFNIIKTILTPFRDTFREVFDFVRGKIDDFLDKIESITGIFKGVVDIIKGIKDGDWTKVWNGIKDVVVNAFNLITSPIRTVAKTVIKIAERMVNAVIDGVNGVIKAIKKIKIDVPDWVPKIGGNTYSLAGSINELSNVSWDTSAIDRLKTGIDFVPNDYYGPVFLDYGERVLTQAENRQYMKDNTAYLNNLSNSSATANNKQLANEIANAIVDSMRLAEESRQPDITQVYIGNEKVYEGYGTHQSRQADRWGTTYVKV